MSGGRGKSGGGGRAVTEDEAELWRRLTSGLEPVKAKPRITGTPPAETPARAPPTRRPEPPRPKAPPRQAHAAAAPKRAAKPPLPLAELDRRKVRQIASGKVEVDDRLDLHGVRERDAHARLRGFLVDAQARGLRTVLVITGKGGDADQADALAPLLGEGRRGVLRRSVPRWLEEPALRSVVLGYAQAGARHGGAGALYVQLRRLQRT